MAPYCKSLAVVLALCLCAGSVAARNLHQAKPATQPATKPAAQPAVTQAACKPTAIEFSKTKEKAFCITQLVRTDPKDPKSAALVTPTTIAELVGVADVACTRLGFGFADPGSIKWGAAVTKCFNGKEMSSGMIFGALSCCAPGTSLARWRETRADMGYNPFARVRDTGAESGVPFSAFQGARVRETKAEMGTTSGH